MAESAGSATRQSGIRPMGPCISAPWGEKELTCWRSCRHRERTLWTPWSAVKETFSSLRPCTAFRDPTGRLIRQLYWDGLPRTGIARQEGVSEGAIRKREQRILKSLHSDLQEALSIPA